jgi:tRNA (mo5U34)-methyltransferase
VRTNPPAGFNLAEFLAGIYCFQKWEIFPGHVTNGSKDVAEHMRRLAVPDSLRGRRVLDIAPWNGFFSFECARRGAAEVVSLGPDDPDLTGYNKVRDLLQLDNCRYVRASVYDLSAETHGRFDDVLFLGLIYHLRHPLLALDRIHDVASDRLFADSPIIDNIVFDKTISARDRNDILVAGATMHRLPLAYFTKSDETGDAYNWFMPNRLAFRAFVESAGFVIDSYDDDGGWASLSATRSERRFTPGLEGWNPEMTNSGGSPPASRAGTPTAMTNNESGVEHAAAASWARRLARRWLSVQQRRTVRIWAKRLRLPLS